ncbi:nuclear transport factor 2 family protein [Kineococcus sp. GCM10028916]|uniref:nuclear transport factor 2 family protein n=1 Tax=Kineococcus sp. GCM10028916 TaxID=3273394 RepID=UPI00362B2777
MDNTTTTVTALGIGQRWVEAWNAPTHEAFVGLFAEDAEYFDVTFGIRRRGHALLSRHHALWRAAIPDFEMTLENAHAGEGFVVVEAIGRGTFTGEPLAVGTMTATMKPFTGRCAAILTLTPTFEIQSCHEYYDRSVMPGGATTPGGQ